MHWPSNQYLALIGKTHLKSESRLDSAGSRAPELYRTSVLACIAPTSSAVSVSTTRRSAIAAIRRPLHKSQSFTVYRVPI